MTYNLVDRRRTLAPVDFTLTGKLRDFQDEAVKNIAASDFGTLAAPTGSGKTVIALALVAQRRQPALVVVHTRESWRNGLTESELSWASLPRRWGSSAEAR